MRNPLVRAVFAALVVATFAAFFVAQQLKSEFPLVIRFAATPADISPNGDGFRDYTFVGFDLSEPAEVKFSLLDSEGEEVRTFVDGKRLVGDRKHRYRWNGRDDEGRRLPDGTYRMRLIRRDEGRVINSLKDVVLDTRPPRPRLVDARPGVITPGARGKGGPVRIRYRGPRNESPEFRIFRTDGGPTRVVARFRGDDRRGATWHGSTRGRAAADGNYTFTVTVRDKAGNRAVAPREIPTAASARAGTGVAVRRLTLSGPLGVVRPGSLVPLRAGPVSGRIRFALSRLGSRRALRTAVRRGGRFRVRIPDGARTGVYLVRVRARGARAVWPVAVDRPSRRRRPLVVLPAITWQGLNPYDEDLDGFGDTLERSRSVGLARPFQGGRLPAGLRAQVEPLLRFLDRERLPYSLTTDLALARGEGPALGRAPGVALAATERWVPADLERRLREYVEGGGTVVSFGSGSLLRTVRLGRRSLRDPSGPRRRNAFGEVTRLERADAGPLVVGEDDLGVFGGDGFIGEFSLFERSVALPEGVEAATTAGREEDRPDFVGYRLEGGAVIRTGTPQWTRELGSEPVGNATTRIWELLAK